MVAHAEDTARCPDRFEIARRMAETGTWDDQVVRIADALGSYGGDGPVGVVLDDDTAIGTDAGEAAA